MHKLLHLVVHLTVLLGAAEILLVLVLEIVQLVVNHEPKSEQRIEKSNLKIRKIAREKEKKKKSLAYFLIWRRFSRREL